MYRHFLATTAISLLLAGPVLAQQEQPAADAGAAEELQAQAPEEAPLVPEGDAAAQAEAPAPDAAAPVEGEGLAVAPAADPVEADLPPITPVDLSAVTAEDIIGIDVRNAANENLGSIDDATLDADGKIDNVVVAFGGFLGFGKKTVELGFDQVEIMGRAGEAPYHAVTGLSADELEKMPEFAE